MVIHASRTKIPISVFNNFVFSSFVTTIKHRKYTNFLAFSGHHHQQRKQTHQPLQLILFPSWKKNKGRRSNSTDLLLLRSHRPIVFEIDLSLKFWKIGKILRRKTGSSALAARHRRRPLIHQRWFVVTPLFG